MKFAAFPPARALAISVLLAMFSQRGARAESSLSYKFQDYHESAGRIAVKTHGALLQQDFGAATHVKVEGVLDSIAGATPNGQPAPAGSDQVPLSRLTEKRKAWNAAASHQFAPTNLALGIANSRESDYVSTGWSVNTLTDFNQKNTTLLVGLAGTDDDVKVFFQTARAKKRTNDVIAGVTQLLSPRTTATLNFTWGEQRGYLADPYKLVQKQTEIIPGVSLPLTFGENRPDRREKRIVLLGLNHAFSEAGAAVDASYRFYWDSYDLESHTLDLAWFQNLGPRLVLRPGFRFYEQTAASFYRYRFDGTPIVPVSGPPRPNGPFYSSDYRLSALQTVNFGFKVIWNVTDALQVDAAFERYDMRGTDDVTPQSAYSRANVLTLGAKFSW